MSRRPIATVAAIVCAATIAGCGTATIDRPSQPVLIDNHCHFVILRRLSERHLHRAASQAPCPNRWDARTLLGKPYLQAIEMIARHKSRFQVERFNGEPLYRLLDFEWNRVELGVDGGASLDHACPHLHREPRNLMWLLAIAGGPPACARERGCGRSDLFGVVVVVVLAVLIVAAVLGAIWFQWERGPFPLIARLLRMPINRRNS
jgi:hypothetical protein